MIEVGLEIKLEVTGLEHKGATRAAAFEHVDPL